MGSGDLKRSRLRRLPSHGTIVAYVALFFALCGSGLAATNEVSKLTAATKVKVRCSATQGHKRVACKVVGRTGDGPAGPPGPPGSRGAAGVQGPPGNVLNGPTVLTQSPSYTFDPSNNPGYLTPFQTGSPDRYYGQEYTYSADSNPENDLQNDVYTELISPSQIGGSTMHISSVQFCIDISPNSNTGFHGTSTVSVDKATVYEVDEPKPAGGAGSGTFPPLSYSAAVPLLQQSYSGETDINDCLTASTSTPVAIDPSGYLIFAITLGLTDSGTNNSTYGTNYIQFGRVTATYTP